MKKKSILTIQEHVIDYTQLHVSFVQAWSTPLWRCSVCPSFVIAFSPLEYMSSRDL